MNNKKVMLIWIAVIVLVVIVLFTSIPNQEDKTINIGASLALTGSGAFIGNSYLDGLNIAKEEINNAGGINGREIELIFEDNQNLAQVGITAFKALQLRNPDLIISTMSVPSVAINSLAKESGNPLFVSMVFADILSSNNNAVSFFPTTEDDARATLKDMTSNSIRKVAIIYINNEYGRASALEFKKQAEQNNLIITNLETFSDANDFSTPLLKISSSNPDAVYVVAVNAIQIIDYMKSHNFNNIYSNLIPVFGSLVYKNPNTFEGVHLTAPKVAIDGTNERNNFIKKINGTLDIKNNALGYTAVAYDNLYAIAKTFDKNPNPDEFIKTISNFGSFNGINGVYNLSGRNIGMTLYPVIFENGEIKEVD